MGLTCTNDPVCSLALGQAAPLGRFHLLDSAAAEQGDCVQLPPGNGPCPTPASSSAGEFFWRRANLSQTKAMPVVLVAFKRYRLSHSRVQTYSWPYLKYCCEFTCNGLRGKAEAGERPPSQPPVLSIPGVNSSLYISLGLAGHHTCLS